MVACVAYVSSAANMHWYLQPEDPTLERSFRGHRDAVTSVAFNSNLKQLISGSLDSCVMVWNFKPQLRAYRFAGHKVRVCNCIVGCRIIQCCCTTAGCHYICRQQSTQWRSPHHTNSLLPDLKTRQSDSGSQQCKCRSCRSLLKQHSLRNPLQSTCSVIACSEGRSTVLKAHTGTVRCVNFSQDGKMLITGSDDKTAKVTIPP